eukprot:12686853-Alexandrium_andersonii.AAC.1
MLCASTRLRAPVLSMVRSLPKHGRADFRMVSSPLGISRHRSQQEHEDGVFLRARRWRASGSGHGLVMRLQC